MTDDERQADIDKGIALLEAHNRREGVVSEPSPWPDDPPDDVQAEADAARDEYLAGLNDADWWAEDLSEWDARGEVAAAYAVVLSVGCAPGRLLGDFRELRGTCCIFDKTPYDPLNKKTRRRLRSIINHMRLVERDLDWLDYARLRGLASAPGLNAEIAHCRERLRLAVANGSDVGIRHRIERRIARYVHEKARAQGKVGKRKVDQAFAVLFAHLTGADRTVHAQRVERSRHQPKLATADPQVKVRAAKGARGGRRPKEIVIKDPATALRLRREKRSGTVTRNWR